MGFGLVNNADDDARDDDDLEVGSEVIYPIGYLDLTNSGENKLKGLSGDLRSFGTLVKRLGDLGMCVRFAFMDVAGIGYSLFFVISDIVEDKPGTVCLVPIPVTMIEADLIGLMKKGMAIAILKQVEEVNRKEDEEDESAN